MTRRAVLVVVAAVAVSACTGQAARSSVAAGSAGPSRAQGFVQRVPVLDGTYGVAGGVPVGGALALKVNVAVGGGCDETGTAAVQAKESARRIVLTATVTRQHPTKPSSARRVCPANLIAQTVAVPLGEPLGTRTVRDGVAGKELKRAP